MDDNEPDWEKDDGEEISDEGIGEELEEELTDDESLGEDEETKTSQWMPHRGAGFRIMVWLILGLFASALLVMIATILRRAIDAAR
ncbi:MAG: hypothetical protein K8S99_17565 [Planctomycetes bacterium]|nr:hypothetical protein [Planctomycetota bacterium]